MDIYTLQKNYDPTHTTALRNAFARDMKKRFKDFSDLIYDAIVVKDCFGLQKKVSIFQLAIPVQEAFAYPRSAEKVEAFMKWLDEQVKKGLLTVGEYQQIGKAFEPAWTDKYITDSYKRGIIRAREELKKAGYSVPSILESGGIAAVFSAPFHVDRVGLIFTRTYSDLKNITSTMDSQISKVLAQGIADGDGPKLIARKITDVVNGTADGKLAMQDTLGRYIPAKRRAEMLARTEIIRAHHLATIQEYRNWGVLGIKVIGEWKTADDERVCDACANLEGKKFTLDEIEPMIPLHPMCRCIALPYIEDIAQFYTKE